MLNISITPADSFTLNKIEVKNSDKSLYGMTNMILGNDLVSDLRIRESNGIWVDDSINTNVNTMLDFKITVNTNREYLVVAVLVKLPMIDKNPMFIYDWGAFGLGSSEPKPIFPIGEWTANNTDVCWAWLLVDSSWSKEMTFKATITKPGTKPIELIVYGIKDIEGNFDESYDSISVTSKKEKSSVIIKNRQYFIMILEKLHGILRTKFRL